VLENIILVVNHIALTAVLYQQFYLYPL